MNRRVWVLGGSGHAKVVISTLRICGWEVVGCYDDDLLKIGGHILGIPVLGRIQDLSRLPGPSVIAIGSNRIREKFSTMFPDTSWVTPIHPTAWVDEYAQLGPGTVVFAGTVVQADSTIGPHCILNTGCSVDHDCRVGAFVHIAPGVRLAGSVIIGDEVMLGIGSIVIPERSVGAGTIVGAGAVVVSDLPPGIRAIGIPARQVWPLLNHNPKTGPGVM